MKSIFVLLNCLAAATSVLAADKPNKESDAEFERRLREGPFVRQGRIPVLSPARILKASDEEAIQIKRRIANLARIDRPDFGLSATMSGTAFAPVTGSARQDGGFLLTDHRVETTDDVRALVALGPKALPFLLEALDDKTPTSLTMSRENSFFTVMYFSNELPGNPTNAVEQRAIAALPKKDGHGESITDYPVKVGDVCFAIIGQIVGRRYLAVRYQPSAIVIINSPTHDSELAKQVRAIWTSTNATRRLLDSLLYDYATEGVFNGRSLDGWGIGSQLQCEAALRLLYYFPRESAPVVANRLARLDVRTQPEDEEHWMDRYLTNGVRAEDFIKAVAWSQEPEIQNAVLNIFKRTTDTQLLLAALPGIGSNETALVRTRLNEIIDRLPPDEPGPYGNGYNLLVALGDKIGDQAKPTFIRYLDKASLQRWRSMSQALRKTQSKWAIELLTPALTDKREFGWTYALVAGQNEPRRPIRVCDEAAETISLSRPDLPFTMTGEHADLDRQIAAMRARITGSTP